LLATTHTILHDKGQPVLTAILFTIGQGPHLLVLCTAVSTVELHLSGCWLCGSPIIQSSLTLQVNLLRILQN